MLRKGHGCLYKAPPNEERRRRKIERDRIKFIDLRFERWQVVRDSVKQEEGKTFHELHVLGMKDDLCHTRFRAEQKPEQGF